jgi:Protein of unknown function (DUF3108)
VRRHVERIRQIVQVASTVAALLLATVVAPQTRRVPGSTARERPVPFAACEVLTYDVSWSNLLTAGTATVTVQDKRASYGSVAHYITAEGRPTGLVAALYDVYYKVDTLLDAFGLLPQRSSVYTDEKGRRKYSVAMFDHKTRVVHYELQSGDPAKVTSARDQPVPPQAQDALSAIFVLRATTLTANTRLAMPVFVNGHVYRVELTVGGRERVQCGLGGIEAWRVTPTLVDTADRGDGRDMAIWISSDARRLPVKLQGALPVGTFMLTLTGATRK